MADFRFFKMAAVRHLGFVLCVLGRQGHDPLKVGNSAIFEGYLLPHLAIYNGGWQMKAEYLKLIGAGYLIFVVICVSRDFKFGSK